MQNASHIYIYICKVHTYYTEYMLTARKTKETTDERRHQNQTNSSARTHTQTHTYIYIYMYVYTYMHTYMYAHMHTHIRTPTNLQSIVLRTCFLFLKQKSLWVLLLSQRSSKLLHSKRSRAHTWVVELRAGCPAPCLVGLAYFKISCSSVCRGQGGMRV